jgi:glutamine amidotransferase
VIVIVDYGVGNPAAVQNMLRKAGHDARVSADVRTIAGADKLILPGVGAFDHAMSNLAESGLIEVLHDTVLVRRTPVLGICLGLQLMCRGSEEGALSGLQWLPADVVRFSFPDGEPLRVPHMGWNSVRGAGDNFLARTLNDEARFYFVHSYHVRCDDPDHVALTTTYGGLVAAGVVHRNVAGTQFHPEKSHRFGLAVLRGFAEWTGGDA